MKLAALLALVLASICSAASWDGTKGNLTIGTVSDEKQTIVAAKSSDLAITGFVVEIQYWGADNVSCTMSQYIPAGHFSMFQGKLSRENRAVFPVPVNQIFSVSVSEQQQRTSQHFGS